jgi:hypothetical protein
MHAKRQLSVVGRHRPSAAIVVVLPRRRRRSEQTPVNLIFVADAGLWHNLFNKPDDSAT